MMLLENWDLRVSSCSVKAGRTANLQQLMTTTYTCNLHGRGVKLNYQSQASIGCVSKASYTFVSGLFMISYKIANMAVVTA